LFQLVAGENKVVWAVTGFVAARKKAILPPINADGTLSPPADPLSFQEKVSNASFGKVLAGRFWLSVFSLGNLQFPGR
jgi:hypothetical protein